MVEYRVQKRPYASFFVIANQLLSEAHSKQSKMAICRRLCRWSKLGTKVARLEFQRLLGDYKKVRSRWLLLNLYQDLREIPLLFLKLSKILKNLVLMCISKKKIFIVFNQIKLCQQVKECFLYFSYLAIRHSNLDIL